MLDGTWAERRLLGRHRRRRVVIGPYNEKIPADVVAAAEAVKAGIVDGSLASFTGPINDTKGNVRVAAGVT